MYKGAFLSFGYLCLNIHPYCTGKLLLMGRMRLSDLAYVTIEWWVALGTSAAPFWGFRSTVQFYRDYICPCFHLLQSERTSLWNEAERTAHAVDAGVKRGTTGLHKNRVKNVRSRKWFYYMSQTRNYVNCVCVHFKAQQGEYECDDKKKKKQAERKNNVSI